MLLTKVVQLLRSDNVGAKKLSDIFHDWAPLTPTRIQEVNFRKTVRRFHATQNEDFYGTFSDNFILYDRPAKVVNYMWEHLKLLQISRLGLDVIHFYGSARGDFDTSFYYRDCLNLARKVGEHLLINSRNLAFGSGAGPGLMEAANRAAYDLGIDSIGLRINLPWEGVFNPYVNIGLFFSRFDTRILNFNDSADRFFIFPGGYGTLQEAFGLIALQHLNKISPKSIIFYNTRFAAQKQLNPESRHRRFYDALIYDFLKAKACEEYQTVLPNELNLFRVVDSHEEGVDLADKRMIPVRFEEQSNYPKLRDKMPMAQLRQRLSQFNPQTDPFINSIKWLSTHMSVNSRGLANSTMHYFLNYEQDLSSVFHAANEFMAGEILLRDRPSTITFVAPRQANPQKMELALDQARSFLKNYSGPVAFSNSGSYALQLLDDLNSAQRGQTRVFDTTSVNYEVKDLNGGIALHLPIKRRYIYKTLVIDSSEKLVFLPSDYDGLDLLFETLCLVQTGKIKQKKKIYLLDSNYWLPLKKYIEGTLLEAGMVSPKDLELFEIVDSLDSI